MDEERKPLWPWIAALLIAVPVLYVASFGPACWLVSRTGIGINALPVIYAPVISRMRPAGSYETSWSYDTVPPKWTLHFCPSGMISRYATLLAVEGWNWRLYVESEDQFDLHDKMKDGRWTWSLR